MSDRPGGVSRAEWIERLNDLRRDRTIDAGLVADEIQATTSSIAAAVRADLAEKIHAAGRDDVRWLASHASDNIDRARLIGAEDAWKAAIRIVRESS